MSLENLFLKRYMSNEKISEGYYLRVRENTTETSVSKNIKVYYMGIKAFDLDVIENEKGKEEVLSINSSVFMPNSFNVFENKKLIPGFESVPAGLLGDVAIIEKYFKFEIGSRYQKDQEKIDFELADAARRLSDNDLVELVKKVYDFFDTDLKRSVKLVEIINNKTKERTGHKIVFFLNRNIVSFDELYSLKIKLLDGVLYKLGEKNGDKFDRYFKNVDINLKCILREDITEESLTFIEVALENRIRVYTGIDKLDYKNTKSSDNQEKQLQQAFMVYLNRNDKSDIMYNNFLGNNKVLYFSDISPFEMEYVIYTGRIKGDEDDIDDDDEKRSSKNVKGRIDNTFVEGDVATLVEIKYGTKVIGDSNGIHKHLIDLYSCLNINRGEILKEYEERVNARNRILGVKNDVFINNIKYDIICIYNGNERNDANLSKFAVRKKIDDIYMKNCFEAGIKKKDISICDCESDEVICKGVNSYCKNLLNMNVPELIGMLNEINCPVRIILVDHEFKEFEEYVYNVEK